MIPARPSDASYAVSVIDKASENVTDLGRTVLVQVSGIAQIGRRIERKLSFKIKKIKVDRLIFIAVLLYGILERLRTLIGDRIEHHLRIVLAAKGHDLVKDLDRLIRQRRLFVPVFGNKVYLLLVPYLIVFEKSPRLYKSVGVGSSCGYNPISP